MKKILIPALLVLLSIQQGMAQRTYEERADSVLALMTLDEKIGQLNMLTGHWEATGPILRGTDKEKMLREGRIGSMLNVKGSHNTRALQEVALSSRLGIPLLFAQDVIHGYRTVFPVPLATAATFDGEAMKLAARVAARESIASGIHWTFSPMLDVSRDPRWGRVMEGPGEDPLVASTMASAMIAGYQEPFEDGLELMACAKHFAGYAAAIGGRDYNTVDISLQSLHNLYLPPFRVAAESGAASFMCAFNEINGVPATAHPYLYEQLFGEWGYQGIVVSDWGSIGEMVVHGYSKDRRMAARQAIEAGVDIDMESNCYSDFLKELVESGEVSESLIDRSVRKVLVQKFRLGLFDDPYRYIDGQRERTELFSESNRVAARQVARQSMVLLKNEGILPVKQMPATVAVIGPLADAKRDMDGNWIVGGFEPSAVTLLQALKERFPGSRIVFEQGSDITGEDRSGFEAAVRVAANADLVLLALGESWNMTGEARSKGDINLPGVQEELALQIYKANPNTVTLLFSGRPMIFEQIAEQAPAVLYAWLPGTEAGSAMVDVITGAYNPSGRLPMTFPKHLGQIPIYYNRKNTGRPASDAGYSGRYIDIDYRPRYPFGYGLSYTSFEYSDVEAVISGDRVSVTLTLANTGSVDGHELVQVYFRRLWGESTRPVKELKAFENISLAAGESRRITLDIPLSDLAYYGQDGWVSPAGDYRIFFGRDAEQEIVEKELTVY